MIILREYHEYKSEYGFIVSQIVKLLDIALEVIEDYMCGYIELEINREIKLSPRECALSFSRRDLEERVREERLELDHIVRLGITRVSRDSIKRIFEKAYRYVLEDLNRVAEKYLVLTRERDREFLGVLFRDGTWLFLEGERRDITIPRVSEESIAIVHTHPSDLCIASREDLESTLDLFVSGGFLSAVISYKCVFIMRLIDLFSEDCYIEFMKYINNYEYFLSTVSEVIRSGSRDMTCFRFEILSLS